MELSIIIVNWNSRRYLKQCLASLDAQPNRSAIEVIVIDNASYDGSQEMLATEFPTVTFIQSESNLGFARANNLAAQQARADALLFLNPDTEIRPGALGTLLTALRSDARVGVVGARLLNTDGSLQTSCIQAFPTVLNQFLDADLLRRLTPRSALWGTAALAGADVARVESISGACLLTSREVFAKVGGFSEAFFMYYEDTDYCLKSVRAGYVNIYVPEATIVHHGGKSSGGRFSKFSSVMMAESGRLYFALRHGAVRAAAFRTSSGLKAVLRIACLALAWPVLQLTHRREIIAGALQKWACVFHWAIGGQRWANRYRPAAPLRPSTPARA